MATLCEARLSKLPALEAKVEFSEAQTAQQIEEHAQTARGLSDVASGADVQSEQDPVPPHIRLEGLLCLHAAAQSGKMMQKQLRPLGLEAALGCELRA